VGWGDELGSLVEKYSIRKRISRGIMGSREEQRTAKMDQGSGATGKENDEIVPEGRYLDKVLREFIILCVLRVVRIQLLRELEELQAGDSFHETCVFEHARDALLHAVHFVVVGLVCKYQHHNSFDQCSEYPWHCRTKQGAKA